MKNAGTAGLLVTLLVLGTFFPGCITPPRENVGGKPYTGDSTTSPVPTPTPTETRVIDTRFVTPATPLSTPTPVMTQISISRVPETTPESVPYKVIYRNEIAFQNTATAYSVTVENPPLFIEMCISPRMVTRNIWYESRFTTRDDVYTQKTVISPNAYLEVRVRDRATGEVLARDGFAKTYSTDTYRVMTVRSYGEYLVEFLGNDVNVTVQMKVPAGPEEAVTPAATLSCPS